MCLGVPGQILSLSEDRGTSMAEVDFGGTRTTICLAFAPDADVGDHVLVHAGFAIAVIDAEAAAEAHRLWSELAATPGAAEDGPAPSSSRDPARPEPPISTGGSLPASAGGQPPISARRHPRGELS